MNVVVVVVVLVLVLVLVLVVVVLVVLVVGGVIVLSLIINQTTMTVQKQSVTRQLWLSRGLATAASLQWAQVADSGGIICCCKTKSCGFCV